METNIPQNNVPQPIKPTLWEANPHLKTLLLVLIFVFLASGVFLVVLMQWQNSYRNKIYVQTQNELISLHHQAATSSVPTTLADGRLQVDEPKDGDTVGNSFTVSGYAQDWFEGTIAIKVYDASSTLLYSGSTIAADNYGHPAPFSSEIILTATSTTEAGWVEFDDYSAKDGSLTYQKKVNVSFSDVVGWKTYNNEQYGFEFPYPSAWIYEVVDGEGSSGRINFYSSGKVPDSKGMDVPDLEVSIDKNIGSQEVVDYFDSNGNFGSQQRVVRTTKNGFEAEKFFDIAGVEDSSVIAVHKGNIVIEFQDFSQKPVWNTVMDFISDNLK